MTPGRAVVICCRETSLRHKPTLRYERRPCGRCGETCVVSLGSVKVIKDHNAEIVCNECSGDMVRKKLAAGEVPVLSMSAEQAAELRQLADDYRNRN